MDSWFSTSTLRRNHNSHNEKKHTIDVENDTDDSVASPVLSMHIV
jgi:hypothetical protein